MTTQTFATNERSAVPVELQGWNWGAFLLNVIWGLAHRCYFALLAFVPFFGLVVPFVLGAKGNAWAWQNGSWTSVEQFRESQRRWTRYALIAYAAAAVGCVVLAFAVMSMLKQSDVYKLATAQMVQDPRALELLGTPVETGLAQGGIRAEGGGGSAQIDFAVTGPKASGRLYAVAHKHAGDWVMESLTLKLADGRTLELSSRAPTLRYLVGNTELRGALAQQQVEAKLALLVPTLAPCFAEATSAKPLQALRLGVAANGSVEQAALIGDGESDPRIEACMSKLIQGWTLPATSDGASATVRLGFMIQR